MLFKTPQEEEELKYAPMALRLVAIYFSNLSRDACGVVPVVTRIKRKVEGESGVHQDYRAIDFRDEMGVGGERLYTDDDVKFLVEAMNSHFPRQDGKLVCIHHAFTNHKKPDSSRAPYHFHLQIPVLWRLDSDLIS
jgi:hypothetical protein